MPAKKAVEPIPFVTDSDKSTSVVRYVMAGRVDFRQEVWRDYGAMVDLNLVAK